MKKLISKLHFRSIYKTIVFTLVLCFLYNIAYLLMSASAMNVYIRQSLEVVLSLLSSLGSGFFIVFYIRKTAYHGVYGKFR